MLILWIIVRSLLAGLQARRALVLENPALRHEVASSSLQEGDLALCPLDLQPKATGTGLDARHGQGGRRQGDGVNQGRSDALGPASGKNESSHGRFLRSEGGQPRSDPNTATDDRLWSQRTRRRSVDQYTGGQAP